MTRVSKEKQDATLDKMQKRRAKDGMVLRDSITKKLEWAIAEKDKATKIIQNYDQQMNELVKAKENITNKILQLNGCILVLKELKDSNE